MDWSEYHLILALSRGSLRSVAAAIGVNETTVARQLRQIETAIGATLFVREGRGLVPTQAAASFIAIAERMEAALITAPDADLLGPVVRVSSVAYLADAFIAPNLATILSACPNIHLELDARNDLASLARRETDISVRLARPDDGRLVIRKAGILEFALAAAAARTSEQLIAYQGEYDHLPEIRAGQASRPGPMALRLPTLSAMQQAVAQGLGWAMLPRQLILPTMVIDAAAPCIQRDVWLVIHEDLKSRPEIRAIGDALFRCFHTALASPSPQS